jgi:hypothetical protein
LIVPVSAALAETPSSACEEAAGIAVLPTPVAPWHGMPLRVIFTAAKPITGELSLVAPDGSVAASSRERHDGPPYFGTPRWRRRPPAAPNSRATA